MANKTEIIAEPGTQELFIKREFDAPRELVFKAHIDPDIYVKWVGPRDLKMTIEKWEPRDGGSYQFTHERDGHKYEFLGVYHQIVAPESIIGTFEFTGLPERGHASSGRQSLRTCRTADVAWYISRCFSLSKTVTE